MSTLVNIFAFVSILISCLGLLGLSSFTADQRAKEIGIRKVHGATSFKLVMLLSQHYAKLMVVAFLIAAPISYYYMQNWLTTFAFRTDPGYMLFVFASMIAFALGISTVSYKSYQAAVANPIKTLKED